ncbi:MAG: hypothetical protein ABIW38_13970 [Ferruginibacter sp.]
MKVNYHLKLLIALIFVFGISAGKVKAQDSTESPTILGIKYFLPENNVPYIEINTKKKLGRKFEPVVNVTVNVYLDEVGDKNLLGKVITGKTGLARIGIPASLKTSWDALDEFKIVAASVPTAKEEALSEELTIKKAILVIDTSSADGMRIVTGQLKEKKGAEWVAVKDIEMKLRIKRLLGNLTVGDEETYTSDSTGLASAEFKKDSMPGDAKGNLVLVARVEDNDVYGNLVVEKTAPWAVPGVTDANFWHRSLWSTGNRSPIWLLIIAIAIIGGVWGTIIYLVRQMFKIKKLGKQFEKGLT